MQGRGDQVKITVLNVHVYLDLCSFAPFPKVEYKIWLRVEVVEVLLSFISG